MAFTGFYWVSGGVPRLFLEFGESGVVLADFDWTKSKFTGLLGFNWVLWVFNGFN